MTVGERIQEARKKAGMKQSDLAEKLGVAVITIGQYERGKREPSLKQLIRIAAVLGVSWYSLVTEDERRRIVMSRNSEGCDSSGVVVGGKIIAPGGIKSKYGVYAGGGIDADGPVEIGLVMQGEMARANVAMEQMTEKGRSKVADYAEDILPRYRAETAPQSPPRDETPGRGTDTTPPPESAEGPQEGE